MHIRIISGTHRGRKASAPKSLPVRPTTDFAKESLFNILANHLDFEGIKALDLFSGTGNISLELASRGAASVVAVDNNPKCCSFTKDTALEWGLQDIIRTVKSNAFAFLKGMGGQYDLIFADPPYDMSNTADVPALVFEHKLLAPDGILVVEHGKETDLSLVPHFVSKRTYGNVNFSLFQ
ncbi:MAG: 16S rRNA (guanine(966)-N(2))-methyltransferase RsmD [Bacteroidia bacterium]